MKRLIFLLLSIALIAPCLAANSSIKFGIDTPDFAIEDQETNITLTGPAGTTAKLKIGSYSTTVQVSGSTVINYVPDKHGNLSGTVEFRYSSLTNNKKFNMTVYKKLNCVIKSRAEYNVNETIDLKSNYTGGKGQKNYRWSLGSGDTAKALTAKKVFNLPGSYIVNLTISDKTGEATCSKRLEITEETYPLAVHLVDNSSGRAINDAKVSLGKEKRKTNLYGKALFEYRPGKLVLNASKPGYDNISIKIELSNQTSLRVNMTGVLEQLPAPKVELISPTNQAEMQGAVVDLSFKVSSDPKAVSCSLLYNDVELLGYRVKDTIKAPANGEHKFRIESMNGNFKWNVLCENEQGSGKGRDRTFSVSGGLEPEEEKKEPEVESPEEKNADTASFDNLIKDIESAKAKINNADKKTKGAIPVLGFADFDKSMAQVKKLRQEYIDLNNLAISKQDNARRVSEIFAEIDKITAALPRDIRVIDSRVMVSADADIDTAVTEYLSWKNIEMSDSKQKKLVKLVKEAQASLEMTSNLMRLEITYLDDEKKTFSVVIKDIESTGDAEGQVFMEIVPKSMAKDITETKWNIPYELVNPDPVVSIYTAEHKSFAYAVEQDVSLDELGKCQSVIMLDPTNPGNKISAFAVLDTGSGTGKALIALIALSVLIAGNYAYFRTKGTPMDVSRMAESQDQKMVRVLDQLIDKVKSQGMSKALPDYPEALLLYQKLDRRMKDELRPIMVHLNYELELHSVNKKIDGLHAKALAMEWHLVEPEFRLVQDAANELPEEFHNRLSKKYTQLQLARQIHAGKLHYNGESRNVDDELYTQ